MRKVRDRETGICRIMPVPAGFRHCLLLCLFPEIEHPLTIDCRQQRIQRLSVFRTDSSQAGGIFLHVVRGIVHAVRTAGNDLPDPIESRFVRIEVTDHLSIGWRHGNTAAGNYQAGNTQKCRYVFQKHSIHIGQK